MRIDPKKPQPVVVGRIAARQVNGRNTAPNPSGMAFNAQGDLLIAANGQWTGSIHLDDRVRCQLMAEVQDPELQETVWRLCEAVALADGHLADGEVELLDRMAFAWRQPMVPLSSVA